MVKTNTKKRSHYAETWIDKKWRPAMGWMYMAICIFDFIVAPILWAAIHVKYPQLITSSFTQWDPLTLRGAGLFHMAMGAVLGLTAWGRTQEKLNGSAYLPSRQPYNPEPYYSDPPTISPQIKRPTPPVKYDN